MAEQTTTERSVRAIKAEALEEAAQYIRFWNKAGADEPITPEETAQWLDERAERIRNGGTR